MTQKEATTMTSRSGFSSISTTQSCSHCEETTKCRRREFSAQAWSALVVWGEIPRASVDQPLCDTCYDELREVLIDRSEEIAATAASTATERRAATAKEKPVASQATSAAKKPVKRPGRLAG